MLRQPWVLANGLSPAFTDDSQGDAPRVRGGLQPLAFRPLPPGTTQPAGWLEDQLTIQEGGQSGHLDGSRNDFQHSTWIGDDAEGRERVLDRLDGMVPLA